MQDAEIADTLGSSTDALLSPEYLHSTGSLVHKSFNELLRRQEKTTQLLNLEGEEGGNTAEYHVPEQIFSEFISRPLPVDPSENSNKNDPEHIPFNKYETLADTEADGLIYEKLYGNVKNPILLKLYNMIQVFLLRHGLTLDFLTIFRRYIQMLHESKIDVLQDKYLLTLQNELSKGFEFSPILQDVITAFLLKPENIIMKLAYFQCKDERLLLKKMFSGWQLKSSLSINLAELEHIWHSYNKKKFLLIWTNSWKIKKQDWVIDAENVYNNSVEASFWERWVGRVNQLSTKAVVADNFFLDNSFGLIKSKHESLKRRSTECIRIRDQILLRVFYKLWKLKVCGKHFSPVGMKNYMLRKCFHALSVKYTHVSYLKDRAMFTQRSISLRPFFIQWKAIWQEKEAEYSVLMDKSDLLIKRRFFGALITANELTNIRISVQDKNAHLLLQYIISVWQKRMAERQKSLSFATEKNREIGLSLLRLWHIRAESYVTANNQYTKTLKRKFLRVVRLKARLLVSRSRSSNNAVVRCIKMWSTKFKICLVCKDYDSLLEKRFLNTILNKQRSLQNLGDVSAKCYNNEVTKRHFKIWEVRFKTIVFLKQKSNAFIKQRSILKLKKAILEARMKSRMSYDLGKKNNLQMLSTFWKIWREQLKSRKILELEILSNKLVDRGQTRLKQKYFSFWNERIWFYNQECFKIAEQKLNISLCKSSLISWKTKTRTHQVLELDARDIYNEAVLSNVFDALVKRYNIIEALNVRLSLYIEERQVNSLLKWTNKWSVKVLKLKRNQESVEMFRSRWSRANLRAILSLWKEKALLKNRTISEIQQSQTSPNNNKLTFQTPMKAPENALSTIPGSERIKRNKMDRIKNRFSRARGAIPSPIKTTQVLDSTMKTRLASERGDDSNQLSKSEARPQSMSLLNVNKRLAGKTKSINFSKIPETDLFGFPSPRPSNEPTPNELMIDLNFLEGDSVSERDDSPTRRRRNKLSL